jgi:hypothetical protein
MQFIETSVFTKRIAEMLTDDEYHALQETLIQNPKAGPLIPGGNGLRKYRWAASGKGKRGGVRIIYYLYLPRIRFICSFPIKNPTRVI